LTRHVAISALVAAMVLTTGTADPASGREIPPGRHMVALGEDRFILARTTDEGVILRFCGEDAANDDPIILLRNHCYVEDMWWLAATGTAVVAAGMSECPPDLFGFTPDGEQIWHYKSNDDIKAARFIPLPGDSTLGYVPRRSDWGSPRPMALPHDLVFPRRPRAKGHRVNLIGEGTRVIECRFADAAVELACRDVLATDPLWTTAFPDPVTGCRLRDQGGTVGSRHAWLAWQCGYDGFPLVSVDLASGAVAARREFTGSGAFLVPEPGGDRLAMWHHDYGHHGRMLILDGATLATVDTLDVPATVYPCGFHCAPIRAADGALSLARFPDCGELPAEPDRRRTPPIHSLVIAWGAKPAVHILPAAACVDTAGRIRVWYEWFSDGSWRHIQILTWRPPENESEEQQWEERWARMRR